MKNEINGIQLYYERRGSGQPVLLLHGGTGIGDDWRHIFPEPPATFELISPDLRGHGRSGNPGRSFTIEQIADDMLAFVDELGIESLAAVGMSLGAKALLHVATKRPGLLDSMVLVSGAAWFPESARQLMASAAPETYGEAEREAMRKKHPGGDEQILALWEQMHAFKDSYDDLNFTPPLLASIRARTLIVHGDSDPLYPVEMAVDLHRWIPDSRLWVVPGAGHVPIFGDHAPEFVRIASSFLTGQLGPL